MTGPKGLPIPADRALLGLSLRKQRLRLTWVLAPLFLLLATPSPPLLLAGASLALPGLALRALAAGTIHKGHDLAVTGPYAYLRHPLYLGTFLVGLGLVVAGGRWLMLLLFLGIFAWMYGWSVRSEESELELRYGEAYRRYRAAVPAFIPRVLPWSAGFGPEEGSTREQSLHAGFQTWLYCRNREWGTALGVLAGFGLLWVKMVVFR
jgi:hypothetical protein